MSKVKLVFVRSFVDNPTWDDTFSQTVDISETPKSISSFHLIAARVGRPADTDPPTGDFNAVIIDHSDFSSLMGQLLTYVDATYSDVEQRKAHKDLVKQLLWNWESKLRERAIQTADSHK